MPSADSSETVLLRIASATSFWGVGVQMFGIECLTYHLSMAALAMTGTAAHLKSTYHLDSDEERISSLIFIKGSGLDALIDEFDLPYVAEDLRETFFDRCRRLKSAS